MANIILDTTEATYIEVSLAIVVMEAPLIPLDDPSTLTGQVFPRPIP